jgi:hypothetical protein
MKVAHLPDAEHKEGYCDALVICERRRPIIAIEDEGCWGKYVVASTDSAGEIMFMGRITSGSPFI